ncbi:hypothetical protein PLESTB_001373700 [Pleodorina starrii]|uniref:Major facilitator superfamily (MFS) profile domain-containing protein n=1 Tax=Pleodorina starrii TaxID=330485 RepID=A0A9W6BVH0_9CHLO|nr:hypothetical protein PLESTM_000411400 [Pleodorina starrii]GLC58552.1 hypothetical protein PLESTB_001373700 [Pleodorina starrii]GLC74205.1 hypothetical protein PLESTF_001473500 [Pleodorina starrii]
MASQLASMQSTYTCNGSASWPQRSAAQPSSCSLPYIANPYRSSAVLKSIGASSRSGWRGVGGASSIATHASHNNKPDQPRAQPIYLQHHHSHQGQSYHDATRTVKIARPRRVAPHQPHTAAVVAVPDAAPATSPSSPSTNGDGEMSTSTSVAPSAAWGWWDSLPSRYRIILGTACSFIICNLDKVNLSVCIIPMARDYGWSPTTVGLVQSAFFWGYMLCQLPGGYFNSKLGGRRILPAGVLLYSAATGIVPAVAATVPGLCLSRAVVGFGQATAPSAATDIVARAVPPSERARAVTFIFSGFHVGSILGLLAAPWLIAHAGWRSVFVTFGALGLVWWLWFEQGIMSRITSTEPDFAKRLVTDSRKLSAPSASGATTSAVTAADPPPLPWRAFLRSTPVRALAYTHFANNWFHYTMLAWLPTYFVDTLSVDLLHASQTALLPPLAGIVAGTAAGAAADALISRGMALSWVRKLMQNIAFLLPTVLLVAACTPEVADNSGATVAAITVALGVSSCSLAGLFCTHQDMNPKYASILLGLTNTTAAIPGVLGVASVGYLFERTESWEVALFLPSAFFMVTAAAVYTLWGRNEPIDFDAADNSPFKFEMRLQSLRRAASKALNLGRGLDSAAVELNTDLRLQQQQQATRRDIGAGLRAAGAGAVRRLRGALSGLNGGSSSSGGAAGGGEERRE